MVIKKDRPELHSQKTALRIGGASELDGAKAVLPSHVFKRRKELIKVTGTFLYT